MSDLVIDPSTQSNPDSPPDADNNNACQYMHDIHSAAANLSAEHGPIRLAVASAAENHVIESLSKAVEANYIEPYLFGDERIIKELCETHKLPLSKVKIQHTSTRLQAGEQAVRAVSSGECKILMKGYIQTAALMRQVLNKENGLRSGRKLSHVLVIDAPHYDRLLFMSDGALNIDPDLPLKIEIVNNAVDVAHALGVTLPKVALLAAIETVDVAQKSSVDTAIIAKMADRGQIKGALVDGPLALDNAINPKAAQVKKIKSRVAGYADILIVDNIDVGNVFYKSLVYFADAEVAGVIAGASAPIVLTSRSDSPTTKFNSIALSCLMTNRYAQSVNDA